MAQNKMSWKKEMLWYSITRCPEGMDKHDIRTFGDSDQNHFYHLYWPCMGGANGVDR